MIIAMKKLIGIWAIAFALVMVSCQKDEGGGNNSTGAPTLTAPANGATNVSLTPTLTWAALEEDEVYDVMISDDGGQTWNTVAEDLDVTTYRITDALAAETSYSWKVAAKRDGHRIESAVFTFTTTIGISYLFPGNEAVTDIRPVFKWEDLGNGASYDLMYSEDEGATWELLAENLTETIYTTPAADRFERNRTYSWKVRFTIGGESADGGIFTFTPRNLMQPTLKTPEDNDPVIEAPTLTWEMPEFFTNDRSSVEFRVKVREAGTTAWTTDVDVSTETSYDFASELGKSYEWQVTATDDCNGESDSEIWSFFHTESLYYADGDHYFYKDFDGSRLPAGADPVILVITADGFTETDYYKNGRSVFDKWANDALDAMFNVEPYKTYKDHFVVYKLVAISPESGITIEGARTSSPPVPAQIRTTKFGTNLPAGNSMAFGFNSGFGPGKVEDYVESKIPGVSERGTMNNTEILVLANTITRAACCWYQEGKRGVSVLAINYDYKSLFIHEFGGHSIGKLGDEYYTAGGTGRPSQSEIDGVNADRGGDPYSFYANLDYVGNRDQALWAKYYTPGNKYYRPGYDINHIEGANGKPKGIWRASSGSVMNSPIIFWFNAIQRESIVRHIMKVAGLPWSDDDFLAKDSDAKPNNTRADSGMSAFIDSQQPHDDVRFLNR